MRISDHDIRYLEALASLRLDDAERERLRLQLARILEYMQQLAAIDVEGVPPTSHVVDITTPLRDDRTVPSMSPEQALVNAPDARDGFYRVPRFVGESEIEP